jgi:hypothetical protein
MIFADSDRLRSWWKGIQLHCFGLISAANPFLACQYLTVRGIRTLNGKLVQHKLSRIHAQHTNGANPANSEQSPIPSSIPAQISYYHFLDESFHFNTSTILSHDVTQCLKSPTPFERQVANLGIRGCQRDHYPVSVAVNGIFWHDPALYNAIYKILRSPLFALSIPDAKAMLIACFGQETDGLYRSFKTHQEAIESYKVYLEPLSFISAQNKSMALMARNSIPTYLKTQEQALDRFLHGSDLN